MTLAESRNTDKLNTIKMTRTREIPEIVGVVIPIVLPYYSYS